MDPRRITITHNAQYLQAASEESRFNCYANYNFGTEY